MINGVINSLGVLNKSRVAGLSNLMKMNIL